MVDAALEVVFLLLRLRFSQCVHRTTFHYLLKKLVYIVKTISYGCPQKLELNESKKIRVTEIFKNIFLTKC